MWGINPYYILFSLPALALAMYAQWRVQATYRKYLSYPNARGMTGAEAAQALVRFTGLSVNLERVRGELSDHYDPRKKTLRLSNGVAQSASVGSVAIVAHEIGHAIQDANAYLPLKLRAGMVPVVNFTSWLGPLLFLVGMLLGSVELATVGVWFFGGAILFALLTLPVELDASRRALKLLQESGMLVEGEALRGARKVLSAAALTYVAALAQAISTMLYYMFILSGNRRRRS